MFRNAKPSPHSSPHFPGPQGQGQDNNHQDQDRDHNQPGSSGSTEEPRWQDSRARPEWPVPTIQNVVATANLECRLDLQAIAQHARNVEYNRRKFHALVMRIREPRTTTLVFASGRMVVTGAKSAGLARLAARRHARAIQKCGFPTRLADFRVQNFVGSAACGFLVRLERISHRYWQSARHEPELFPGLVYTMVRPSLKCLVFTTGKVVLTGAKKREDVFEAFANLYPLLLEAKVEQRGAPPMPQGEGSSCAKT
ncbi:transcription factor TFIID-domain-containing protein [Thermothelomyces heterothallicus CBS 202.75]|uniref:transcription factor TFIID-domain-containing protein n=1 Tax=Thermothelomyces heterothallicus CBS 202.75 TaxID=1149848 RepID=UPI0037425466